MKIVVTVDLLNKLNACDHDVVLFEETFPNGTKLNEESIDIAMDADLDVGWFFRRLLKFAALGPIYRETHRLYLSDTEGMRVGSKEFGKILNDIHNRRPRLRYKKYLELLNDRNNFYPDALEAIEE